MSIDTDHFRRELLEERARASDSRRSSTTTSAASRSLEDETGEARRRPPTTHLGGHRDETFDRELDEALEENARDVLARDRRRRSSGSTTGDVRHLRDLRQADPERAARGRPVGDALHRRKRKLAGALSEPRTRPPRAPLDVRVGSSTNALRPILAGERPLGAGLRHWVSLAAIVVAAVAADQLTKQVVARALALGEEVARRRPVLDPPRPELGDRVRPLRERDADRDRR